MQLVQHHRFEVLEEAGGVGHGDEQRQLLRRRQQDFRRRKLLPLALVGGRIAGARLDLDTERHLGNRRLQIALDVDGQRLQRRNVERVDAAPCLARLAARTLRQFHQRRQETRQRLARAGGSDQQHRFAALDAGQQFKLMRARLPTL